MHYYFETMLYFSGPYHRSCSRLVDRGCMYFITLIHSRQHTNIIGSKKQLYNIRLQIKSETASNKENITAVCSSIYCIVYIGIHNI